MKDELFQELMESVTEMAAVRRGDRSPGSTYDVDDESLDVAAIRSGFNLSRSKFAALLGISPRTLEGWEQGRREPTGPSRVLMKVAAKYPESVLAVAAGREGPKASESRKPLRSRKGRGRKG